MTDNTTPTLDFDLLSTLDGEQRDAAIAEYSDAIAKNAAAEVEKRYSDELRQTRYANAKYRLLGDKSLVGFAERIDSIEALASENPALASLCDEERLRTAYYIDRGMNVQETPSAEKLIEQLSANPEAMRKLEAAMLEKLRTSDTPTFMAQGGAASVPLTPVSKPKSIDEASALARAAFGI